jgi:hypothetical protein
MERMDALYPTFSSVHMQSSMPQIDLAPSKRAKLRSSETMSICEEDRCRIPNSIASSPLGCFDQSFYLLLSQIFSYSISNVGQSLGQCSVLSGWGCVRHRSISVVGLDFVVGECSIISRNTNTPPRLFALSINADRFAYPIHRLPFPFAVLILSGRIPALASCISFALAAQPFLN